MFWTHHQFAEIGITARPAADLPTGVQVDQSGVDLVDLHLLDLADEH